MADKVPEWRRQEELRKLRRSKKKHPVASRAQKPQDMTIRKLVLVVKPKGRDEAFHNLRTSNTLHTYFPNLCRGKAAWDTRRAGRIELEGPACILDKIEYEMRTGWQRGKLH